DELDESEKEESVDAEGKALCSEFMHVLKGNESKGNASTISYMQLI
ncbi:14851_t:CDS:2, partial [Entrophospora sp. SA101]